ncbi:MAG: hypothetical protein KAJ93_02410 [Methanosarcinales archaeon]|nr:hypothetical protein [Methanosarcinales archaeon]
MAAKIVERGDPIEPIYLNNLRVAAQGWGYTTGLAVSQKGAGANMSVDIATGTAVINGTSVSKVSITNVAITAAHATYDRYDLIVINSSGTISAIDGTAAAISYANDYDLEANNAILLAEVYVPATDTTIEDAQITDKRIEESSVTDAAIAAVLSEATIDGAKSNIAIIASDTYNGNSTVNRAIPHGLGKVPKHVHIYVDNDVFNWHMGIGTKLDMLYGVAAHTVYTVTEWDETNFYVGQAPNYDNTANITGRVYTFKVVA